MTRKLICGDGQTCSINHKIEVSEWENRDVAGVQVSVPVFNCGKAPEGKCNGTTVIDHGDCMENCPACRGIGFVRVERPIDHPQFGILSVCRNKPVNKVEDISGTGLHRDDMQYTWESYKQTQAFKQIRRAFDVLKAASGGWLYLFGPPGTGKTVGARAFIADQIRQGKAADTYYITHSLLIKWLNAAYSEENGQQAHLDRLKWIQNKPFLAIDEIGQGSTSTASMKNMNEILTARNDAASRGRSKTILISNFAPEEAGFDPHILDRIRAANYQVINVVGMSMRQLTPEAA